MDEYRKRVEELRLKYKYLPQEIKTCLDDLGKEVLSCPTELKLSFLENLTEVYQNSSRIEEGDQSREIFRRQLADLSYQIEDEMMPKGEVWC